MNEEHDYEYTLHMNNRECSIDVVLCRTAIKYWPGSPQRPYEEQEQLNHMRDQFQRMRLDYSFRND